MLNQTKVESYIKSLPEVSLSHQLGQELAVYNVQDKMFAIIEVGKKPLRISLRCDRQLGSLLKSRYEEVMAGYKLNKDKWITIVNSGQLQTDEIKDLINHAYQLVETESFRKSGY